MDCPVCRSESLVPIKLEHDLPAYGCQSCQGALVSLLYYRDWAERTGHGEVDPQDSADLQWTENGADDNQKALACPKCKHLMRKFLVSGQADNRVDLCGSCDEVWLDGGEWLWLKSLHLHTDLVGVLSEQWQLRVKREALEQKHHDRFVGLVGEDVALKADEIRKWLKDHPRRQDILYYLSR